MKKESEIYSNINFHKLNKDKIFEILETSDNGLDEKKVQEKLKKYGYNEIPKKKKSILKVLIPQIFDYVIIILLICAFILLIFSFFDENVSITSSLLIFGVVFLNSMFIISQMFRTEKSLKKLQELLAYKATVIRNGKKQEILAKELVPGDIILLTEGDYIPADIRILEARNLYTDESLLTGESLPVEKTDQIIIIEKPSIYELKNIAFNGTVVIKGNGKGVVIKTGINTYLGQVAKDIETISIKEVPLQKKMKQLGRILGLIVLFIIFILFIFQLIVLSLTGNFTLENISSRLYQMVSLVVAAIPWNFPLIISIILLIGIFNMAKQKVIVRKLATIESLGRISVICTDKTGTITKNEMTIVKIWLNNKIYTVEGSRYMPIGDIKLKNQIINPLEDKYLKLLIISGVLNINADLIKENDKYKIVGDPTEGCIKVLALKAGINDDILNKYTLINEISFDSQRMMMSRIFKQNNKYILFTKGSIEKLLEKSDKIIYNNKILKLNDTIKKNVLLNNKKFNDNALRTLGFCYKHIDKLNDEINLESLENDLIFIGFVGMIDPPKEFVKEAIIECKKASIKTVMLTGDSKNTAKAIAKSIGLLEPDSLIIEGTELDKLSQEDFEKVAVFSRISPSDKIKIVKGYKQMGHLIAMTGDGINDAPALEMADAGVAMGSGTTVAKFAADIIILDDNFTTIVKGIREGRGIFDNIRKCVMFQLVNNLTELTIMALFIITFSIPISIVISDKKIFLWDVFTPNQLYFLYFTTHTLPILALILEPYEKDIMKLPPKNPKEGIISVNILVQLILQIISISIVTCLIFYYSNIIAQQYIEVNPILAYYCHIKAQTMALVCLFLSETWNTFNVRTFKKSIISNILSNKILLILLILNIGILLFLILTPLGENIIGVIPLNPLEWLISIIASFFVILTLELYKYILRIYDKVKKFNK